MKNTSCIIGIFGIVLILLISGCGVGSNFVDGLVAISGQGGKIAREDAFGKTVELANRLNKDQPSTKWETAFECEGADFIGFLDKDRLLVGTVESGSYLGVPKHGDIKLFNAKTGAQIWSAGRDGMGNGQYVLLVTDPLIVIVGRDDDVTKFLAYDPLNGSKKWKHRVNAPDQFILSDAMDRIISLSASGGGRKIEALDIKTGNIIWSKKLSSDSFSRDIPDVLIQGKESFFAAGKKIIRIAEKDGSIIWSKSHPILESKDRAVTHTSEGILVYNSGSVTLLREKDGAAKWVSSLKKSLIKCATVLNKKAYRVTAAKSGPGKDSSDTIQALSVKSGKVLWSKPIKKGKVVSPLCMDKDVLAFTTDNAIYGLKAKTGEQRFRNPFSKKFISGCPSSAKVLKRPDIIQFRSGKLYLAREMSGIRAYAFPSGKKLWEQLNFNYQSRVYSADRLYELMARDLPQKPFQQTSDSGASAGPVFSSSSPSPFIQSAQRRYESERQRTSAVLSNRYATKGARHSAHQTRAMNARLMAAQQEVDMAMGRMQAAGDLLVAVVGLQGAIQNALTTTATQGAISRKYLELRSLMGLQKACLQGKYYLWPFYDEGRGVTIVDLDTGKRNDLVFSPRVQPLEMFGVDLPSFCIAPDGKTLVMVGVGMNPAKYDKYVKWKYRMPKPSVLAYDVSMVDFMQKSLTQQRAEERAVREKKKAEAMVKEMQTFYDKSKIHSAAQAGNLKMVKSMLDSGVDANVKHPHDETSPLVFAIIGGNPDIVRLLVIKGANVNEKDKRGKSILFWAKHFKNKEIIKILKDAGAR